jgi:hypothetical protein
MTPYTWDARVRRYRDARGAHGRPRNCGAKEGRIVATVIDLDDVQPYSEDMDEMRPLLRRVVGKPFLFFRASYGDELTLHLGEPTRYSSPKMDSLRKGSFLVATRASGWILESGSQPGRCFMSDDVKIEKSSKRSIRMELREIEKQATILPGSLVTDAMASPALGGMMLSLAFTDGSSLVVLPRQSAATEDGDVREIAEEELDPADRPLADWEVFMPRHRILKVGPSPSWSCTDSSKPAEDSGAA